MKHIRKITAILLAICAMACMTVACGEREPEPQPVKAAKLDDYYGELMVVSGCTQRVDSNGICTAIIPKQGVAYVQCSYIGEFMDTNTVWIGIDNRDGKLPEGYVLRAEVFTRTVPEEYNSRFDLLDNRQVINDFPIYRIWIEDGEHTILSVYPDTLDFIIESEDMPSLHAVLAVRSGEDEPIEHSYQHLAPGNAAFNKNICLKMKSYCDAVVLIPDSSVIEE